MDSRKYSLVYPPGTIADRVESDIEDNQETVGDVRGARVDKDVAKQFFMSMKQSLAQVMIGSFGREWDRNR